MQVILPISQITFLQTKTNQNFSKSFSSSNMTKNQDEEINSFETMLNDSMDTLKNELFF